MMRRRLVILAATAALAGLSTSCKTRATAGEPESSLRADSADNCGGEAMATRRKETFDRTVSCAADAAGVKAAEAVRAAVVGVQQIGALARAMRAAQTAVASGGATLNVAKTALCLKVLADNVTQNTIKNTVEDFSKASPLNPSDDAEYKSFALRLGQYVTLDTISTFENLGTLIKEPGVQNFAKFGASALQAGGDWASVITSCSQVFASAASVVAPNVAQISTSLKSMQTLGTIGALVNCTSAVIFNSIDVGNETACLLKDLEYIAQQKKAIQRALAFDGSRAFNHARYSGCNCVNSSWWDSAETELNKCRACCESGDSNPMRAEEPKKSRTWTEECKLSCGVAYTQGIFVNYTDTKSCAEVKSRAASQPKRIIYRYISLLDKNSSTPAKQQAEEYRAYLLEHAKTVKASFSTFDTASGGGSADGLISVADFAAAADASGSSAAVKAAGALFGKSYTGDDRIPYFFKFLETASEGGDYDGLASSGDVDAFIEEVERFIDESEMQ